MNHGDGDQRAKRLGRIAAHLTELTDEWLTTMC
jgi:hypothetical protein